MAGTQELLQAVLNMQRNAQEALPVIPNNGNPRGANNMPGSGAPTPAAPPPPADNTPSWVKPSISMEFLKQLLQQPLMQGSPPPQPDVSTQPPAPPVQPGAPYQQPQPVLPMATQRRRPIPLMAK